MKNFNHSTVISSVDREPPSDNMGVENIKSWHVDYLTITVWCEHVRYAFDNFFAERGIFRALKSLGRGGRFYYETYTTDLGVTVRENPYDGSDHCTIEIPGTACQMLGYQGLANFVQILRLNYEKVRVNRVDVAFDDCDFKVQDVIGCLDDDELRSYFKRETIKTFKNPYELNEKNEVGTSGLTIGGRSSTRYMRVYDKHGYTRLEVEFKSEKADQVAHDIFDCKDEVLALRFAMGHVMDYVEFFSEWWQYFVSNFERLYAKLPKDVQEITIEKIKLWFESQIASAFYVMGSLEGQEYFDYLKFVGKNKYKQSRYDGLIEMNNLKKEYVV